MKQIDDEHLAQWRKDLPKVQRLAPYGKARANARFRLVPTHPDSERLSQAFYAWALRTGIFPPETAGILNRTQMGYLVYWHAPLVSDQARWLIGTFHLWVTAVDDFFVERGLPLDDLALACDDAIRNGNPGSNPHPYVQFFIEHRDAIIAAKGEGLLPQIADQVERYFRDWKQEQVYLKERCLPTLADYLRLRIGITALYGQIHSQRIDAGLLPHDKQFGARLDKIAELINVVESLNGDIIGIQKDIEEGYPINVIPVIALEFGVDLPTAYMMAVELLDLYKSLFDALVVDVMARPGRDPEAAAQAKTMGLWLDGFHTWHSRGARHGAERAPDATFLPRRPDGDGESIARLRAIANKSEHPEGRAGKTTHLGVAGLGTSALRLTESLNEAEMLREWAKGLLGWSTPSDPPKPKTDAAAPFTEIKPTGLGNAAATLAALATTQSQSKSPGPSNDAPGANPPIPGLTGLGTQAASLSALAPKAPEAALPSSH